MTKITLTRLPEHVRPTGDETVNEDASLERWAELMRAQLSERFSGASVEIPTARTRDSAVPDVEVEADSAEGKRVAIETVKGIAASVSAQEDWIVPEVGG